MKNLQIDKIKFYFTTDLEQNKDVLDKSLFEFVEKDGKYQIQNVVAKILS